MLPDYLAVHLYCLSEEAACHAALAQLSAASRCWVLGA